MFKRTKESIAEAICGGGCGFKEANAGCCSICLEEAERVLVRVNEICDEDDAALVAQRIEQGFSTPEVVGSNPTECANFRETLARAIWAVKPDCYNKKWPLETDQQRRAYPHNPIASCDICFMYADAVIKVFNSVRESSFRSDPSLRAPSLNISSDPKDFSEIIQRGGR